MTSRSTRGPRLRWTAVALAAATVASGCSGATGPEEDPAGVLTSAVEELGELGGIAVLVAVSSPPQGPSPLAGLTVELRSTAASAAHVRIGVDEVAAIDAPAHATIERGADELRTVGLSPVGDALAAGGWIRVGSAALEEGADTDRVARRLSDAGVALLETATVTWVGEETRGDRFEVATTAADLTSFLTAVADVTDPTVDGDRDGRSGSGTDGSSTVTFDAWVAEGALTGLRSELLEAGGPLPAGSVVDVHLAAVDGDGPDADRPSEAPPAPLRGLLDALGAAATTPDGSSGGDGDPDGAPSGSPADPTPADPDGADPVGPPTDGATGSPTPDTRPSEPPRLREGGVLEEVFGDGEAFVEGEPFDCVTEADLDLFEEQLGTEARAELEELVTAGYVERC